MLMKQLQSKRKVFLWSGLAILILAVLFGSIVFALGQQKQEEPDNPIKGLNLKRSQELITGKDFNINKQQEKVRKQQEKKKKQQQKKDKQESAENGPSQNQIASDDGSGEIPGGGKEPGGGGGTDNPQRPDEDDPDPEPEDPQNPIIKTNLKQNEKVAGDSRTFWVNATDYRGKRSLGAFDLLVKVNDAKSSSTGTSGSRVNYKAKLKDGANIIQITATDDKLDKSKTVEYTVYGDTKAEKEYTGTVTFSLEASTLSLGKLIGPAEVDIYEGEQASEVLDRVLHGYGYTYDHDGSVERGFYLVRLRKSGITSSAKIPDDLLKKLEEADYSKKGFEKNSLGQHDYTNGSGWMFSVNGGYPGVGMSGYNLRDGDRMRVRFTLYYGMDIGGATPDAPGGNWEKEW